MNAQTPIHVVQITDTHLFAEADKEMRGCVTFATLQSVVHRLMHLTPTPDLLLLTGDLSQDETRESYQRLYDLLAPLNIPAYWIPGNHDCPMVMSEVLSTAPFSAERYIRCGKWAIALLDSTIPGSVDGEISLEQLTWLDQQLQQTPGIPTLIALHHSPVPVGSDWMDQVGLRNGSDLLTIVDRHPHIKGVLFGHIHQEFDQSRGGVRYLASPSSCVQFVPNSPNFAIDDCAPGFRCLTLYPDGEFHTTLERLALSYQP